MTKKYENNYLLLGKKDTLRTCKHKKIISDKFMFLLLCLAQGLKIKEMKQSLEKLGPVWFEGPFPVFVFNFYL